MKPDTERDYRRRIARVIDAIIREPHAPHTVERLAALAHFSPFHFHRIYRNVMGETVAETVQRLRLAEAADRLAGNADSIADVAADVGYESAQAFARAFRKFAGVSPAAFRARRFGVMDLPRGGRVDRDGDRVGEGEGDGDGDAHADRAGGVALCDLPPSTVLCVRHHGPLSMIPQTYRSLLRELGIDAASAHRHQTIGLCSGNPRGGDFEYLAGVIDDGQLQAGGSLQTVRLEGGLYASQRLVGPYALIGPTLRALFDGWLPRSGFVPDRRPTLELYRDPPLSGLKHRSVTDLAIAVRAPLRVSAGDPINSL